MKKILLLFLGIYLAGSGLMAQGDAYFVKHNDKVFYTGKKPLLNHIRQKEEERNSENLKVLRQRLKEEKMNMGSPLFYNGWTEGYFKLSGGQEIRGKMALDIMENTLMYEEMHQNTILSLRPLLINLHGHELQRYDHLYANAGPFYYEKVVGREYLILKKYSCQYEEFKGYLHLGYDNAANGAYEGEYIKDTNYYLAKEKTLHLITDRSKFYRIFGKRAGEIKQFVQNEGLDLETLTGVETLIAYVEKL